MLSACNPQPPQAGTWKGQLALNDSVALTLRLEVEREGDALTALVVGSGPERIRMTRFEDRGDSLVVEMPVFNSYFTLQTKENRMEGTWHYPDKGERYTIPFVASPLAESQPLPSQEVPLVRYEVHFSPGTSQTYPAVGEFRFQGNQVLGTFLTETGDYRFLEGTLINNTLQLSAFDGAHAFAFVAQQMADGSFLGTFYSGKHFSEPFEMRPNSDFQLADPEGLTALKPGYSTLEFAFPDTAGKVVGLSDPRFQNKVVIVQIMGSWCPNCMDETRYLTDVYNKFHELGLEVIGLAFEHHKDPEKARLAVVKMQRDLQAPYPFVLAGSSSKQKASEALPMLTSITSFPTTVVLDRKGQVRKIHTGFSGPGTSGYTEFTRDFKRFIAELLAE
jgi:peroxiredoxin